MSNGNVLIVLALAVWGCGATPTAEESASGGRGRWSGEPPNVLLVSIDTLRADYVAEAPYLSRLAAEGRSFRAMYASSNWTLPSHVSLFTSTPYLEHDLPPPGSTGAHPGTRIPPAALTLASVLREAGFATAATTEGGWIRPEFGFARGFERFEMTKPVSQGGSDVFDRHLASIRDFLEGGERPFFLFVHTYRVHDYFVNSLEYHDLMTDEDARFTRLGNLLKNVEPAERSSIPVDFVKRLYLAGVRRADRFLQDVVETVLEVSGGAPILVVVTSDHGEGLGESPGAWGHGRSLEEDQIRIPLVAWSNVDPDLRGRVDVEASTIDVAPSVVRWLGLEVPSGFRGASDRFLVGTPSPSLVLARQVATDRERTSQGQTRQALISRGWKYVRADSFDGRLLSQRCVDLSSETSVPADLVDGGEPECVRLSEAYSRIWAARRPLGSEVPADLSEPDPEMVKQLQALGYLE